MDVGMPRYSDLFKAKMVQRLMVPMGPSYASLSRETGVKTDTLAAWVRQAQAVGTTMARTTPASPSGHSGSDGSLAADRQRRPDDWPAQERLKVVLEAEAVPEAELGEFLRRHGLHEATLAEWRSTMLEALGARPRADPSAKRVREREAELLRKDRALAEAAALLVLQKKLRSLWGDEDDGRTPTSGG